MSAYSRVPSDARVTKPTNTMHPGRDIPTVHGYRSADETIQRLHTPWPPAQLDVVAAKSKTTSTAHTTVNTIGDGGYNARSNCCHCQRCEKPLAKTAMHSAQVALATNPAGQRPTPSRLV
jgi:hypothetical protein